MSRGEAPGPRGRRAAQGERTRQSILGEAVQIASTEGLEGLSIGRLASELGMSKSGLFGHFGSKEDLQLATVEAARAIFVEEVVRPALAAERGLPRLWGLCEAWLSYLDRKVFRGGCFFIAASTEFDSRPGPVRDRVAAAMRDWLGALERAVREAQAAGHLETSAEPAQVAFELNALAHAANWAFQLYGDPRSIVRARAGILRQLRALATPDAPGLPAAPVPEESAP